MDLKRHCWIYKDYVMFASCDTWRHDCVMWLFSNGEIGEIFVVCSLFALPQFAVSGLWFSQGKSAAILNSEWTPCSSVLMTSYGCHKLFPTTWLVLLRGQYNQWNHLIPTPALLVKEIRKWLTVIYWTQYSISKIKCIYSSWLYSPRAKVGGPWLFK